MAVNEGFYPNTYNWESALYNEDTKPLFKTTDKLINLLQNFAPNQLFDNSNVYSTFNPAKYNLNIAGSCFSRIVVDRNEQNITTNISCGNEDTLNKVNLRYLLIRSTARYDYAYSAEDMTSCPVIFNWTDDTLSLIKSQYTQFNQATPIGEVDNYVIGSFRQFFSYSDQESFFINEINRDNLFISLSVNFKPLEGRGSLEFTQDDLNPLTGDSQLLNSRVVERNGVKYVPTYNLYYKTRSTIYNGFTTNDSYKRNDNDIMLNVPDFIVLVGERIIDGKIYYYFIDAFSCTVTSGNSQYNRSSFQGAISGTLYNNFILASDLDSYNDFLCVMNYDGVNTTKDYIDNNDMKLLNNNYIRNGQLYPAPYTVMEMIRLLSLYLIPFDIEAGVTPTDTINSKSKNMFIGIRNPETGEVEGDFIPYVWGETEPEKELYPPDFTPYDPNETPDTPVTPDDWGDIPLGYLPSNATNAFVTYYLMDNVALSYLGQSLWHGLQKYDPKTNTNFIDNFFFIPKYEDGYEEPYKLDTALTLSSIIDYFPSLKYYPVPQLNTLARATVPFDYIYVGTSATQIPVVDESHPAQNYFVGRTLFTVDGGVITRNELLNQSKMFNNFLDYEPYTSCTLYVPYCGTIELQPSTIFDQNLVSLQLTYAMDIASGSMTAILVKNGVVNYPIAVAQGTIGFDIMLSGSNFTSQMVNAQLNQQVRANNVNKNLIGSFNTALGQAVNGNPAAMFTMSGAGAKAIYDTLNNNLSYPQSAGTSPISVGMTSSLAGCLQPSVAYIQVVKHSSPIVGQYGDVFGYTGNIMGTIGSQNGFFKAINPRLDGIPCNEYERDEIYNLLTSGVYWQ